jgi:hypothetical protein
MIMNKEIKLKSDEGQYITISYFEDTGIFFLEVGEETDDQDPRVIGFDKLEFEYLIHELTRIVEENMPDK